MTDVAKLLLRISVGGLMLFHGVHKLVHGIAGIRTIVESRGVPGFVAYGVLLGEVVAPLLVLIGLFTRLSACVVAINMLVAVWLAHLGDLFHLGRSGGYTLELQAFYFFGALSIALLGAGRYSASRGTGRWN